MSPLYASPVRTHYDSCAMITGLSLRVTFRNSASYMLVCPIYRQVDLPFALRFTFGSVDTIKMQDSEKPKIVQSISSVIQALPPEQEVEPIHVRAFGAALNCIDLNFIYAGNR